MKVKQVMHKGVTWVTPETPVAKVAKEMKRKDVGAIPVGKNDRLVGMVTDRDIVCRGLANGKAGKTLSAGDVMTKGIVYCRTEDDVTKALRTMKSKKIRRLPVIDAKKRMVGILSLGDIARKIGKPQCADVVRSVSAHHA
ncbi:MAG: CBS domain-containing protein [Rhizomicrobium sp.]